MAQSSVASVASNPQRLGRRSFLAGGSALLLAGCGGEGKAGKSPQLAAALPIPTPTPTPTATPAPVVYGPDVVTVRQFYQPEHGNNLQPAFQKAIREAEGSGRKVVNDFGAQTLELWAPVRRAAFNENTSDGVPLLITESVHIDFAGANFVLRGPGGGKREQVVAGSPQPWLGGWIYALGHDRFDKLVIENATVDGGFSGDWTANNRANLSDKGFRLQDTTVKEIYMRNVEMRNFWAEIYYIGGLGPHYQELENCHFHGSPQCAFNPGGIYKLKATNLQAGRAYQTVEAICGSGHTYTDCRFYDAGNAGAHFMPGPCPIFREGFPYWYTHWDGVGTPPHNHFNNVTFENNAVRSASFSRRNVKMIDSILNINHDFGRLEDVDLVVDSICDKWGNEPAVTISGPVSGSVQVTDAPPGTYFGIPKHIKLDIRLKQTAAQLRPAGCMEARSYSTAAWSMLRLFPSRRRDQP